MVVPAEFTYRKSSKAESTILFDGVDDNVALGNIASQWSQSLTKFSFSVWVYITTIDATDRMIVQHGTISTAQSFRLYYNNASGLPNATFQIRNAANNAIEGSGDSNGLVTQLLANQWVNLTCVYDNSLGSQNIKMYINGVYDPNSSGSLTEAINLSAALTLADATADFKGNMKDFKFWNATALSQQNVTDLLNGKWSLAPLPSYWLPMNEGSGSPTNLINNANTGGLTNGAAWNTMTNAPTSLGLGPDLGGTGLIDQLGENNIWPTATSMEVRTGTTKYRIIYVRYTGTDSPVKQCSFAQFSDTSDRNTKVEWAFDPSITDKYKYNPGQFFDGFSSGVSQADSAPLRLTKFSVACWFRAYRKHNSSGGVTNLGYLVTKGQNDAATFYRNYSIFMKDGQIWAGFEDNAGAGVDHETSSPLTYNDGKWHFAVVTYDQVNVTLYIDGAQVGTPHATGTTPFQNTEPLSIGKQSTVSNGYFLGDIDEVRVWNNNLTAEEVLNLYNSGTVPQSGAVVYSNLFGTTDTSFIGQQLINEVEEPFGSPTWQAVTDKVPDPANIGDFKTNQYIPILLRYTVNLAGPELSIENDLSTFRTYFAIQATQGGGGGDTGGQPPASNDATTVIFNGDWGEESQTTTMVNDAKAQNPNIVLTGGDNMYASSGSGFYGKVKSIDNRQGSTIILEAGIGNHDKSSDINGHFGYSNGYHSHRINNIFVLFLDTENSPTGSAQVNFGKAELEKARKDHTIDWIIVCFHRPIFTASNSHHSADEGGLRSTWMPIFEQFQVDLVCQSHVHSIQRSYPVKNNAANNPQVMQNDAGPYNNWPGIIFCVDGTGGHDNGGNLYKLSNQPAFNIYQNDSTNMNLKLVTSNNGKTLTCSFSDTGGSLKHSWVMTRS